MTLLILGFALFVAVHAIPWAPACRVAAVRRLGENGYKGVFSLVAFVGIGLIVYGKASAGFTPVWQPPAGARWLSYALVWVGFMLFPAAHMKTNVKRYTRHPMLWGVVSWGVGHLLVNGDAASMVLFGGLVLYSLAAMVSANARGARKSTACYPVSKDLAVAAAGSAAYVALLALHGWLFGYPLI